MIVARSSRSESWRSPPDKPHPWGTSQIYSPLLGSRLHVLRTRNCLPTSPVGATSMWSLKMFCSSWSSDRSPLLNESSLCRGVMGNRRLSRRPDIEFSREGCTEFAALATMFWSPSSLWTWSLSWYLSLLCALWPNLKSLSITAVPACFFPVLWWSWLVSWSGLRRWFLLFWIFASFERPLFSPLIDSSRVFPVWFIASSWSFVCRSVGAPVICKKKRWAINGSKG